MPAVKIIDADTNEEHLGESISGHVCFWHKAEITRLSPMSAQLAASFHFVSIQESGGARLTPVPTLVVQSADYG